MSSSVGGAAEKPSFVGGALHLARNLLEPRDGLLRLHVFGELFPLPGSSTPTSRRSSSAASTAESAIEMPSRKSSISCRRGPCTASRSFEGSPRRCSPKRRPIRSAFRGSRPRPPGSSRPWRGSHGHVLGLPGCVRSVARPDPQPTCGLRLVGQAARAVPASSSASRSRALSNGAACPLDLRGRLDGVIAEVACQTRLP